MKIISPEEMAAQLDSLGISPEDWEELALSILESPMMGMIMPGNDNLNIAETVLFFVQDEEVAARVSGSMLIASMVQLSRKYRLVPRES